MSEKERLNQETDKIRKNKFLKLVDRNNAVKSVRSLSKTIDDLISMEKEKIDGHYNSKLIEKARVSAVKMEQDALKESSVYNLKASGTLNYNLKPSPGGTTDSLAFSQSIAMSNLAGTIPAAHIKMRNNAARDNNIGSDDEASLQKS